MSEKVIYAAILGAGTVGMGTYKLCQAMEDEIKHKTGARLVIKKILVRNISKKRDGIPDELLTDVLPDYLVEDLLDALTVLTTTFFEPDFFVYDLVEIIGSSLFSYILVSRTLLPLFSYIYF